MSDFATQQLKKQFLTEMLVLDQQSLREVGEVFRKAIVHEAKKDFAKHKKSPYGPQPATRQGMPPSFFDSFVVRASKDSFSIVCNWPWLDEDFHSKPKRRKTPVKPKAMLRTVTGRVVVKSTELKKQSLWVHPSYDKNSFISRGVRMAKKELQAVLLAAILERQLKRKGAE